MQLISRARRGADRPSLVIEDLHWAAEPLVEVLERVLSDAEGPVLVLATMRPGAGRAFPAADVLSLERLADEEVTELVEAALARPARAARTGAGRRPRARETRSSSRRCSRTSLDRGLLERERRRLGAARRRAVDLGIPDSVQGVLAARIDLLPVEAKEALQAASVIGRSFTSGRPGRADRLERRGAHPRGARLRPPHGARARLQARAHPRRRLRQPAEGEPRAPARRLRALARGGRRDGRPRRRARAPLLRGGRPRHRGARLAGPRGRARAARGGGAALAAARRRALAGALRPRRRPRRSFTAPPSSRRATPSCGMRSAG